MVVVKYGKCFFELPLFHQEGVLRGDQTTMVSRSDNVKDGQYVGEYIATVVMSEDAGGEREPGSGRLRASLI